MDGSDPGNYSANSCTGVSGGPQSGLSGGSSMGRERGLRQGWRSSSRCASLVDGLGYLPAGTRGISADADQKAAVSIDSGCERKRSLSSARNCVSARESVGIGIRRSWTAGTHKHRFGSWKLARGRAAAGALNAADAGDSRRCCIKSGRSGEVVTRRSAKPPCVGSNPACASTSIRTRVKGKRGIHHVGCIERSSRG